MRTTQVAIYGGGGFGSEVVCWVEECGKQEERLKFVGFIDDNVTIHEGLNGYPVFTLAHFSRIFPNARVTVSVADPQTRERMARRVEEADLAFQTLSHPSVIPSSRGSLGIGSIICAGCVMTTGIVIGRHVQINMNSTIGHDVTIGNYSTLGPGVHIGGWVQIGERVLLGAGAVVVNGSRSAPIVIGDDVTIGAGSVVLRSLPEKSHVFGVPARPIPGYPNQSSPPSSE